MNKKCMQSFFNVSIVKIVSNYRLKIGMALNGNPKINKIPKLQDLLGKRCRTLETSIVNCSIWENPEAK